MRFQFTPAAQRALTAAGGWTSFDDSGELDLPEVLLGLLAEPECRAALMLAEYNVDAATVHRRFPALTKLDRGGAGRESRFSDAWRKCLDAVEELLVEYPRPLELATEHLLLGLTATDNEVSRWLAECGLYPDALEAEVHRLSGHQPGPLPLDTGALEPRADQWVRVRNPGEGNVPPEQDRIATLRVIDAAANRAGEGLRVIEDYLRFALDDRHLTSVCKSIRHELTETLRAFPSSLRHAARDTRGDVGTDVSLPAEQSRSDSDAVLEANFKRVEQSLRSLEEYSKIAAPLAAAAFEQLRYRVYTLERALDLTRTNLERLAEARLYVLVDGGPSAETFARRTAALVTAGVSILQLRDKTLSDRELLDRARLLCDVTRGSGTLFVMNDRPDLAVLAGADGVHVGQEELNVKDARRILGPHGLVGVSTHSLEQARAAVLDGADYIGIGPTFPSDTKQFAEFTGPELLRAVNDEIRLPAFAIGGITADNLPAVLATGVSRIAVSGAVTAADDPAAAARQLLAKLPSYARYIRVRPCLIRFDLLGRCLDRFVQQLSNEIRHFVSRAPVVLLPKALDDSVSIQHQCRWIGHCDAERDHHRLPAGAVLIGVSGQRRAARLQEGFGALAQLFEHRVVFLSARDRIQPEVVAIGKRLGQVHDLRELANARGTPRAPIIDERHATFQIVERHTRCVAGQTFQFEIRQLSPDGRTGGPPRLAAGARHQPDVQQHDDGQHGQRRPERQRPCGRAGCHVRLICIHFARLSQ